MLALTFGVIALALSIGVLGYHHLAGFTWVDSILNASMILGGMGPVGELQNDGAKLFASAYAIFSGLVFISVMGIVLAPAAHRLLTNMLRDFRLAGVALAAAGADQRAARR